MSTEKQIRNAKTLLAKAMGHTVEELPDGMAYRVTSGESGNSYIVTDWGNGYSCTCDWGKYRPAENGRRSGCSHVLSVITYQQRTVARRCSAWATEEDARRQHRPVIYTGNGAYVTSRKAGS